MPEIYEHGVYSTTEDTQVNAQPAETTVTQIVIGTAPVHLLDDPASAVNKPILCRTMADCYKKIGYSEDFKKYTLCQSMYASFSMFNVAPVVFINVLDPATHYKAVEETPYTVNDNTVTINDDVIVSTLVIKSEETPIAADKYVTEWLDGVLTINFTEDVASPVTISYNKVDPTKVTAKDIIGSWDTTTDVRTGAELIGYVYPMFGVVPSVIIAPGWTTNDTIGAVLSSKTTEINGNFSAVTILDIDTASAKTRSAAIAAKKARTFNDTCIFTYPLVKKGDRVLAYSAVIAALTMSLAASNDGVTCKSPSNKAIDIDDVVLADGTSLFYNQLDGNELNAEGIVTIIARNGWYTWGNNTAAYPATTDPVKRWIVTHMTFDYMGNDFINKVISKVDENIDLKLVENAVTDYNITLAGHATEGRIIAGKVVYDPADNDETSLLLGRFKTRMSIGGNIPAEVIKNVKSYDVNALTNALFGGEQ